MILLVIILLITIVIGTGGYLILKPKAEDKTDKTDKPKTTSELMDEAVEAFGIKVSDNLSNNVIFNTSTDILKNFPKFFELAFPLIDKSAINKILKDNSYDKTVDQLLEIKNTENKLQQFIGFDLYSFLLYIYDENSLIYQRLWFIVSNAFYFLQVKEKYPSALYLELSNDFKTSAELYIYFRNIKNKNKDKTDTLNYSNDDNCFLTSQLCNRKMTNILDNDEEKNKIINNKEKVINFVNYIFVLSLLLSNNINPSTNLTVTIENITKELNDLGIKNIGTLK